jgi:hypothetical protein
MLQQYAIFKLSALGLKPVRSDVAEAPSPVTGLKPVRSDVAEAPSPVTGRPKLKYFDENSLFMSINILYN